MPSKKPVRDAERTRAKLLACAEQLFVKRGYHDVGVDEVAAAAGFNKRMIYVYFGSKRGLYDAVIDSIFERLNGIDVEAANAIPDYLDRLTALLLMYFNFLRDNPSFVRLLQWENLYADKASIKQLVGRAYKMLGYLVSILSEGVENGRFRKDLDVRYLAFMINAQFIAYFTYRLVSMETWELDFGSEKTQAEVLHHMIGVLFKGVLAEPCPKPAVAG